MHEVSHQGIEKCLDSGLSSPVKIRMGLYGATVLIRSSQQLPVSLQIRSAHRQNHPVVTSAEPLTSGDPSRFALVSTLFLFVLLATSLLEDNSNYSSFAEWPYTQATAGQNKHRHRGAEIDIDYRAAHAHVTCQKSPAMPQLGCLWFCCFGKERARPCGGVAQNYGFE